MGVTGVAVAAAVALVLDAFIGVVGNFDAASDLATAVDVLSFLSPASKNNQRADTIFKFESQQYNWAAQYGKDNYHATTTLCSH